MALFDIFNFKTTQPQNANVPNYRLSPMVSRGDVIYASGLGVDNRDKNVGEIITSIRCGTGGNLVVQGPSGGIWVYLAVAAGQTVYGKFAAVLSSGTTASGVTVTTTADNITWYGGEC